MELVLTPVNEATPGLKTEKTAEGHLEKTDELFVDETLMNVFCSDRTGVLKQSYRNIWNKTS